MNLNRTSLSLREFESRLQDGLAFEKEAKTTAAALPTEKMMEAAEWFIRSDLRRGSGVRRFDKRTMQRLFEMEVKSIKAFDVGRSFVCARASYEEAFKTALDNGIFSRDTALRYLNAARKAQEQENLTDTLADQVSNAIAPQPYYQTKLVGDRANRYQSKLFRQAVRRAQQDRSYEPLAALMISEFDKKTGNLSDEERKAMVKLTRGK